MKKLIIFLLAAFPVHACAQQRIENCLLAAAYGDALGRVTEFIPSTEKILRKYPKGVRSFEDFVESDWSFLPARFVQSKVAPYTDDTAMAVLVLEALTESEKNKYDLQKTMGLIAHFFVHDMMSNQYGWDAGFRAPGLCCKKYVAELHKKISENKHGTGWWKVSPANGKTGGCGSVMHAYPFGLVFSYDPEKAKLWAAEHSMLTHGDSPAVAACAAMAVGTAYALHNKDRHFIIDAMIAAARDYDADTADAMVYAHECALKAQKLLVPEKDMIAQLQEQGEFRKSYDQFFTRFLGWSARDALAGVVYLFILSPTTLDAIHLGVHTPGDSDSIASLAGALVGACSDEQDIFGADIKNIENYQSLRDLAQAIVIRA